MNAASRALGALVLVLGALAALSGCSQDASPAEEVPTLTAALEQVDTAVEAENYEKARSAVEFLLTETRRAQQDDELSPDEADRIRAAARSVLASLPAEQTDPEPQQEATTEPEETSSGGGDEPDEKDEKDRGKPEKDDDKPGKGNGSDDD